MITSKRVIITVLIGSSLFGLAYLRAWERGPEKATHSLGILDPSQSVLNDPASFLGIAQQALDRPALSDGSTLTIMILGNQQNRDEPQFVAQYDIPKSTRSIEGRGGITRKKDEILSDLQSRLDGLKRTDRSPIYLGIRRGMEALHSSGCQADSSCLLFIRTDGEELAEKSIREAIQKNTDVGPDLPAIANEGISVLFCGLSEVDGPPRKTGERPPPVRDARRVETLHRVWLSRFTVPDLVLFNPICPRFAPKTRGQDRPRE